MTQSINIQIPGQSLAVPLPKLLALLADEAPVVAPAGLPAAIGAELQGGIYVGPMVEDGQLVHLDLLKPEAAQEMLQRNPNSQLVTIPNVGHAPMLRNAEQIDHIDYFLAG